MSYGVSLFDMFCIAQVLAIQRHVEARAKVDNLGRRCHNYDCAEEHQLELICMLLINFTLLMLFPKRASTSSSKYIDVGRD